MDKLAQIQKFAYQVLEADQTGHSSDHIDRVAYLAKQILAGEPEADSFLVLAAVYLHDTIDDKLVPDEAAAIANVRLFLTDLKLDRQRIEDILFIIENMSFSKELEMKQTLSLEGQIVQDADRLDALGAWGILRTAYFGGSVGHPIYDKEMKPVVFQHKNEYRKGSTVINHFYEKLFLLPERMNTLWGQKEAQRRVVFMKEFLKEFYLESNITDNE